MGAAVLAFLFGLLAGTYVLGRPAAEAVDAEAQPMTYTVESGSLGRTIPFAAVARWEVAGQLFAPASGVITEILHDGGPLVGGEILLRVGERPMTVLPGAVPAFRTLEQGAAGRDVAALNAYLASLGYSVEAGAEAYTVETTQAVRDWQAQMGVLPSGSVELGDVLFIAPEYMGGPPFRVSRELAVGGPVSSGSPLLERLEEAPSVVMEFGGRPPDQLTPELGGIATFRDGTAVSVAVREFRMEQGRTIVQVMAADGGGLCEPERCLDLVPSSGDVPLNIEFVLVPETPGPLVPAAAIQTDAIGRPYVVLGDGSPQPVEIVVTSGGLAIVDGVEAGEVIELP
ncbi:hypothetical protein BH23CHL10_BH23CHL10_13690 [soil metagenome]